MNSGAKSYDELCQEATSAAESRLLEHFKNFGGEVWTIGTGCENCRQPAVDTRALKRCSGCQAALFCDGECLKKVWRRHKSECNVIATFRNHAADPVQSDSLMSLLEILGYSTDPKNCVEPKVMGVATSLAMQDEPLPGWFFDVDYDLLSKDKQKVYYDTALALYALLREEESWTRDKDSFPRSSYTYIDAIPHVHSSHASLIQSLVDANGHLLLFSAWLQHPEPPATQSMPLEDRGFYGVIDSLLQVSAIRDAIDAFMDSR